MVMFLYLQNLPPEADNEAIRVFFTGLDIPMGAVRVYDGPPKEAHIWFGSEQDLLEGLMRNEYPLFGYKVRLWLVTEEDVKRYRIRNDQQCPASSYEANPVKQTAPEEIRSVRVILAAPDMKQPQLDYNTQEGDQMEVLHGYNSHSSNRTVTVESKNRERSIESSDGNNEMPVKPKRARSTSRKESFDSHANQENNLAKKAPKKKGQNRSKASGNCSDSTDSEGYRYYSKKSKSARRKDRYDSYSISSSEESDSDKYRRVKRSKHSTSKEKDEYRSRKKHSTRIGRDKERRKRSINRDMEVYKDRESMQYDTQQDREENGGKRKHSLIEDSDPYREKRKRSLTEDSDPYREKQNPSTNKEFYEVRGMSHTTGSTKGHTPPMKDNLLNLISMMPRSGPPDPNTTPKVKSVNNLNQIFKSSSAAPPSVIPKSNIHAGQESNVILHSTPTSTPSPAFNVKPPYEPLNKIFKSTPPNTMPMSRPQPEPTKTVSPNILVGSVRKRATRFDVLPAELQLTESTTTPNIKPAPVVLIQKRYTKPTVPIRSTIKRLPPPSTPVLKKPAKPVHASVMSELGGVQSFKGTEPKITVPISASTDIKHVGYECSMPSAQGQTAPTKGLSSNDMSTASTSVTLSSQSEPARPSPYNASFHRMLGLGIGLGQTVPAKQSNASNVVSDPQFLKTVQAPPAMSSAVMASTAALNQIKPVYATPPNLISTPQIQRGQAQRTQSKGLKAKQTAGTKTSDSSNNTRSNKSDGVADMQLITKIFPDGKFYLQISGLDMSITARGVRAAMHSFKNLGVLLAWVHSDHGSMGPMAFGVFEDKTDLNKIIQALTLHNKDWTVSQCTREFVDTYLHNVEDDVPLCKTMDTGNDVLLTHRDRMKMGIGKGKGGKVTWKLDLHTIPSTSPVQAAVSSYSDVTEKQAATTVLQSSKPKGKPLRAVSSSKSGADQSSPLLIRSERMKMGIGEGKGGTGTWKLDLHTIVPSTSPVQAAVGSYSDVTEKQAATTVLQSSKPEGEHLRNVSSSKSGADQSTPLLTHRERMKMGIGKGKGSTGTWKPDLHTIPSTSPVQAAVSSYSDVTEKQVATTVLQPSKPKGKPLRDVSSSKRDAGQSSPLSKILPISADNHHFYLTITNPPSDISASALYKNMCINNGKCQGVILVRTATKYHKDSVAFGIFEDEEDLEDSMGKLEMESKLKVEKCTSAYAKAYLSNLDESSSLIFVSLTGYHDRFLVSEERKKFGLSRLGQPASANPMQANPPPATNIPLGIVENRPALLSLFPISSNKGQFYLAINVSEFPNISACSLLKWLHQFDKKVQGVLLVDSHHMPSLPSMAFGVFEDHNDLVKGMELMKLRKECKALNLFQYSSVDVRTHLEKLDPDCSIYISTEAGKDKMLTKEEKLAHLGIKKPLSGHHQSWALSPIFPVPAEKQQFYLGVEVAKCAPNINANRIFSMLKECSSNVQGVLLARVPKNHRSLIPLGFGIFENKVDLEMAVHHMGESHRQLTGPPSSHWSNTDVSSYIKKLSPNCMVYINTVYEKDRLLTLKERASIGIDKTTVQEPGQFAIVNTVTPQTKQNQTIKTKQNQTTKTILTSGISNPAALGKPAISTAPVSGNHPFVPPSNSCKAVSSVLSTLFPVHGGKTQFYLTIFNPPINLTASELCKNICLAGGKIQGILLVRIPPEHPNKTSVGFGAFEDEQSLAKAILHLESHYKDLKIAKCSSAIPNAFLCDLGEDCLVYTSSTVGCDRLILVEERKVLGIWSEKMAVKPSAVVTHQLKESGSIGIDKTTVQKPGQFTIVNTVTPQTKQNQTTKTILTSGISNPAALGKPGISTAPVSGNHPFVPPSNSCKAVSSALSTLFPIQGGKTQFYLTIFNPPINLTASEVCKNICLAGGKIQGILLVRIPPEHSNKTSVGFGAFEDEQSLEKAILHLESHYKDLKIAKCSSAIPNAFLHDLGADCLVYASSTVGCDRLILVEERKVLGIWGEKMAIKPSAVVSHQSPVTHGIIKLQIPPPLKKLPNAPTFLTGATPIPGSVGNQMKVPTVLPTGVCTPPVAGQPLPGLPTGTSSLATLLQEPQNKFYLQLSHQGQGEGGPLTASRVWNLVDGIRGKSVGVILARGPPAGLSLSYIVYENQEDLSQDRRMIKEPTVKCSAADIGHHFGQCGSKVQIWLTNPALGKDSRLDGGDRTKFIARFKDHVRKVTVSANIDQASWHPGHLDSAADNAMNKAPWVIARSSNSKVRPQVQTIDDKVEKAPWVIAKSNSSNTETVAPSNPIEKNAPWNK